MQRFIMMAAFALIASPVAAQTPAATADLWIDVVAVDRRDAPVDQAQLDEALEIRCYPVRSSQARLVRDLGRSDRSLCDRADDGFIGARLVEFRSEEIRRLAE